MHDIPTRTHLIQSTSAGASKKTNDTLASIDTFTHTLHHVKKKSSKPSNQGRSTSEHTQKKTTIEKKNTRNERRQKNCETNEKQMNRGNTKDEMNA